jgi:hypothetical protein
MFWSLKIFLAQIYFFGLVEGQAFFAQIDTVEIIHILFRKLKIVLTYYEILFKNSQPSASNLQRVFSVTRTIYSSSERSGQFLKWNSLEKSEAL